MRACPSPDHDLTSPIASWGFTLIEMLAVVVMLGALAGMAVPKLEQFLERARVVRAIGDINAIQLDLMAIEADGDTLPPDLNAIGRGSLLDPWGHPYVYLRFETYNGRSGMPAGARIDQFYKPLNSTFDLYSLGKDGTSATNLNAAPSQDDVVRALDGGFIGLGRNF